MQASRERNVGLALIAVGAAIVVLAVLLFGLTTDSGAVDWISVITAVAGLGVAYSGLSLAIRGRGGKPAAGGPHPRPAP
jgi:hypothetical protein